MDLRPIAILSSRACAISKDFSSREDAKARSSEARPGRLRHHPGEHSEQGFVVVGLAQKRERRRPVPLAGRVVGRDEDERYALATFVEPLLHLHAARRLACQ